MNHTAYIQQLSPDLENIIHRALEEIASQKRRTVKCPYCSHNAIVVFEDARGHIQTKCRRCGRELVIDVVNMRRMRPT